MSRVTNIHFFVVTNGGNNLARSLKDNETFDNHAVSLHTRSMAYNGVFRGEGIKGNATHQWDNNDKNQKKKKNLWLFGDQIFRHSRFQKIYLKKSSLNLQNAPLYPFPPNKFVSKY